MKNIITKITFILFLGLLFSCSGNDDSDEETNLITKHFQVTGQSKLNDCDICSETYQLKIQYLSEGEIIRTRDITETTTGNTIYSNATTGNLIGAIISLPAFDENNLNSGLGTSFENVSIKILDSDSNVIFEQELENLFIGTDIVYQVRVEYNIEEDLTTIEYELY